MTFQSPISPTPTVAINGGRMQRLVGCTYSVCIDGEVISSGLRSISDALTNCIAAFFVFDVKYPCKHTFQYFELTFLNLKLSKPSIVVSRFQAYMDALEKE